MARRCERETALRIPVASLLRQRPRTMTAIRTRVVDFVLKQYPCDFVLRVSQRVVCVGGTNIHVMIEGPGLNRELEISCWNRFVSHRPHLPNPLLPVCAFPTFVSTARFSFTHTHTSLRHAEVRPGLPHPWG